MTANQKQIKIIDFETKYADQFKQLNLQWLNDFDLLEPVDYEMLNDPGTYLHTHGGFILLAVTGTTLIGTVALLGRYQEDLELAKFTISKEYRGKGIAKLLLNHCLEKATGNKSRKIWLYSSSKLTAALQLYEQYGFKYLSNFSSHYKGVDVKMELLLL